MPEEQESKIAKIVKVIAIIAGVVLVIGFVIFAAGANKKIESQNAELAKKAEKYDTEVTPWLKAELEKDKEDKESSDEQQTSEGALHLGSCVILFTDPSKIIIDAMTPSMDLYEQVGVVALPLSYQESSDILSLDDIKGLVKKGWEFVLRVTEEDLRSGDKVVEAYKFYISKKIPICQELYNADKRMIGDDISVCGNMNDYAKIRLDEAVAKNQAYALAVGTLNLDDHFESDNLDAMLKLLWQYETAKTVEITTVTGALDRLELAMMLVASE